MNNIHTIYKSHEDILNEMLDDALGPLTSNPKVHNILIRQRLEQHLVLEFDMEKSHYSIAHAEEILNTFYAWQNLLKNKERDFSMSVVK